MSPPSTRSKSKSTSTEATSASEGSLRQPYRPQSEIRRLMLETAYDMLMTMDLPLGLDNIKMEEVIKISGVPRGSGYRVWSSEVGHGGPQGRFRHAVAQMVLADEGVVNTGLDDFDELAAIFERIDNETLLAMSPQERGALLRETVRIALGINYRVVAQDPLLRVQQGLTAIVRMRANPAADEQLAIAADIAGRKKTERLLPMYERAMQVFGLRVKPCYTMEQFAYAALALSEGSWMRPSIVDSLSSVDDDGDEWTLMAIGFMGLIHEFAENDPDSGPVTEF